MNYKILPIVLFMLFFIGASAQTQNPFNSKKGLEQVSRHSLPVK